MKTKQTRREFLGSISKITWATIGAMALGNHLTLLGSPVSAKKPQVTAIPDNKILITYASKSGSTAEIAKYMGNILSGNDDVDVLRISEVKDLAQYNQVIVGSPIRYDKWMDEARYFIKDNEDILAEKDVSFFLVCLVLCGNTEKTVIKANEYVSAIKKVTPKINVRSFGQFKGVLDYSKMSFPSKILMKPLMATKGLEEGDYRDWKQIGAWAKKVSLKLT